MFFGKKTLPAAPKPAPEAVAKPEWDLQTVVGLLGRLAIEVEHRNRLTARHLGAGSEAAILKLRQCQRDHPGGPGYHLADVAL